MRVKATNPWGHGEEVLRKDLWVLDLGNVISELINNPATRQLNLTQLKRAYYFAISIGLPELSISPETYRRDSRPYSYPGWDGPASSIKVAFWHERSLNKTDDVRQSAMYQLLSLWRMAARSGRGPMSGEPSVPLTPKFLPYPYRFDVPVSFVSGLDLDDVREEDLEGKITSGIPTFNPETGEQSSTTLELGGLEVTARYVLKKAWLSSLQLGDLTYVGTADGHVINATLQVEGLLQQ